MRSSELKLSTLSLTMPRIDSDPYPNRPPQSHRYRLLPFQTKLRQEKPEYLLLRTMTLSRLNTVNLDTTAFDRSTAPTPKQFSTHQLFQVYLPFAKRHFIFRDRTEGSDQFDGIITQAAENL